MSESIRTVLNKDEIRELLQDMCTEAVTHLIDLFLDDESVHNFVETQFGLLYPKDDVPPYVRYYKFKEFKIEIMKN